MQDNKLLNEKVTIKDTGEVGTVILIDEGQFDVRLSDGKTETFKREEFIPVPAESKLSVVINLGELVKAKEEGSMLVFNPSAENGIIKLLDMHKRVSEAIAFVTSEIERQGLEYNPNFTSVVGDIIKANYSAAGAIYKEDPENKPKHRKAPFWTKKVTYGIDSKEVSKYEMKHRGRLPVGITKPLRNKKIQFKVKGGSDD